MSKYGNERDLEIATVVDFIKAHKDIKTTLDVGAHSTWNTYAKEVKAMVNHAEGIDIAPDPKTARILDGFWIGNVTDDKLNIPNADLVFSISSIEHSGISTYKSDWKKERVRVFKKMYNLADKYLIVTCPFGAEMIIEGQYANITHEDLTAFGKAVGKPLEHLTKFYYTPAQQSEFTEIPYNEACNVEFDPNIGIP